MLFVQSYHSTLPAMNVHLAVLCKTLGFLGSSGVGKNVICRYIDSSLLLLYHSLMRLCGLVLKFNLNKFI